MNLTHLNSPVSTINITPASPLHSYTCISRWFNLLVCHLSSEKYVSPTSPTIKQSMVFVRSLIQEQTGLKVDQPDTSGGTTSTGSVARRVFSNESKYFEFCLSVTTFLQRTTFQASHPVIRHFENF